MKWITVLWLIFITVTSFTQDRIKAVSLFDTKIVHKIYIDFYINDFWDSLQVKFMDSRYSDESWEYIPAQVMIDGQLLDSVGIRFKGNSSFNLANDKKKPFKIDFNEFIKKQNYQGYKKINLHNGFGDPTMQREHIAYRLLREMGVMASRTSYTELYINNEYWGLYLIVEQIDKSFLRDHFSSDKGLLLKNMKAFNMSEEIVNSAELHQYLDPKTKIRKGHMESVYHFLQFLNTADNTTFRDSINQLLDVPTFLKTVATRFAIKDLDSYYSQGHNYYLYYNPDDNKISMIPWDLNLGFDASLYINNYDYFEQNCIVRANYSHSFSKNTFYFKDRSTYNAKAHIWDFGDGTKSKEINPAHSYSDPGIYEVCLSVSATHPYDDCTDTFCKEIIFPLGFSDCNSTYPIYPKEIIHNQVVALNANCCESWNHDCSIRYRDIERGGLGIVEASSLWLFDQVHLLASRPLFSRIMQMEEYRVLFKVALASLIEKFDTIIAVIQNNHELISPYIERDRHYLYKNMENLYNPIKIPSFIPVTDDIDALIPFIEKRKRKLFKIVASID